MRILWCALLALCCVKALGGHLNGCGDQQVSEDGLQYVEDAGRRQSEYSEMLKLTKSSIEK